MRRPVITIAELTAVQKDELHFHNDLLVRVVLQGVMKMYAGIDFDSLPAAEVERLGNFMLDLQNTIKISNAEIKIILACKHHRVSDQLQ